MFILKIFFFTAQIPCFANIQVSAHSTNQKPEINSPGRFGVGTGKNFFYYIPVSGERPMVISVSGLPKGIQYNKSKGVIFGKLNQKGDYALVITAKNKSGKAVKKINIVAGDTLALTPPMGWSSWYSYGRKVTEKDILKTAYLMKKYKLDQYGWGILEIDDPWTNQPDKEDPLWEQLKQKKNSLVYEYHEGPTKDQDRVGKSRDQNGTILPNKYFSNIKKIVDQIHGLGFKVGIYSSPGPLTCGGVTGSYGYELQDARYFASTGFDYLKYDWCSYGVFANDTTRAELMKPYTLMGNALKAQSRDIIFSLCQYGMGNVWEWGAETGGQLWRTGVDVHDDWKSVYAAFRMLADKSAYVQPGRWNDPDILQIGAVGAANRNDQANHLTHQEQMTVMSMWCVLSAPIFIGANLEHLDSFSLSLLTNNEVIAVNQDILGKAAELKYTTDSNVEVWAKTMADGKTVIALLNTTNSEKKVDFAFSSIGKNGKYKVRNLWLKKNIGEHLTHIETLIPTHGTILISLE